jgi:GNAT superfamily N-acetyltransferase
VTFSCAPLGTHPLDDFDCGNPELTTWLRQHAGTATGHGTRTTVLLDDRGRVRGYFAIAPHLVDREELPPKLGRGAPRHIPAILLAKLALDVESHGQGLGTELLLVALRTIIAAARSAGGKLVVVDAIDDRARSFYEHHDFARLPNRDDRLVLKLSTAAKALDEPWP